MNRLLEDYQLYVAQLQERLNKEQTYFHKFSTQTQVVQDIEAELAQINALIHQFNQNIKNNRRIQMARKDLIPDHYDFESVKLLQLEEKRQSNRWSQYLKINQQVTIKITLQQIIPIVESAQLNQEIINFQCLKFHLHHVDKMHSSPFLNYHPKHNIYSQGDLVEGKIFKQDRKACLQIAHQIRPHNIHLYTQLFQQMPIKIIAEASYGLVLGVANISIDDLANQCPIRNDYRCITFKNYVYTEQGEQIHINKHAFIGKVKVDISFEVIAPQIKELQINAAKEVNKKNVSKSRSPNRMISLSPSKSQSPKRKRQLLTDLTKNASQLIELTIYEGQQYRYKLEQTVSKREITYRQLKNIKQRRIEMVKMQEKYYLKCYLIRQKILEDAHIHFQFDSRTYLIHVVTDHLFQTITHEHFIKIKQKKKDLYNKLVCINNNELLYPRQSNKIVKNFIKQASVDGLLSNVFIKTVFSECQIFVNSPFVISDILHKQDGYMINYYYCSNQPMKSQLQTSLIFFLSSKYKRINQIHIFQCTVTPRTAGRDTISKQLRVNQNQSFYKVGLRMIGNQNVECQIRSTCLSVNVINGKNYRYELEKNQDILLQIFWPLPPTVDIIFNDSKSRCFFIRLSIVQESTL